MSVITAQSEAIQLIKLVDDLAPAINSMREEMERERRLPDRLVNDLRDLGFYSLWLAHSLGGPELNLVDYIRVIERLAQCDGSVALCVTNGAAYSGFSSFLPEHVARQIFVEERAVLAGGFGPIGRAFRETGGFRVTGRWPFGSGILNSSWVTGGCTIWEGDGPRLEADGSPETRVMLFPSGVVEVLDTWDVGGLRATGSHDYQLKGVFVPEEHSFSWSAPLLPGPLSTFPSQTAFVATIVGVPLGIARTALNAITELCAVKKPRHGSLVLRDRPVVQDAVGRLEADLRAARAFLFQACEEVCDLVDQGVPVGLEQRAMVRLACTKVTETARIVVQGAYDIGGGTSVYESSPLQRCFRDAHAVAQHVQVHTANYEAVGRVILGLDPGTPIF